MKEITSVNNSYIKELMKLKQKKYRDEEKRFLVEGYHLVEMAKECLEIVLVTKKEDVNKYGNGIQYILVKDEIIKKLSDTKTPQGIIGVCKIKDNKDIKEIININNSNKKDLVVMLDGLQDPGNIGTIIRTSLSFGVNTIVFSDTCVDCYNEKVIRGSQGGIFKINMLKGKLIECISEYRKCKYDIIGTSLNNASSLDEVDIDKLNNKKVIVFGNEGNGVSEEVLNNTDINLYIPINDMESLNVGVAAGILLYILK